MPFLVAGADVPRAQSLDCIAQPMDILPSLLDLAGVELTPPKPFDGKSFARAVVKGEASHRDYAVSGSFIHQKEAERPRRVTTPFVVTNDGWGYAPVGAEGAPELYRLDSDPLATKNLAGEHPDVLTRLQALFLEHLREHDAPAECLELWEKADLDGRGSWAPDYPDKEES